MTGLTDEERERIRQGVRGKYLQVAAQGAGGCFQYPTGRQGLQEQGYPPEIIVRLPAAVLEAYCGVGNPFSLGPLYPGEAVLDIGCGAGVDSFVAAHLVGPGGRVVGLDLTPEMVDRARDNLSLAGLANVSFQVGEAESLPFPDNEFDAVISNGVLNLTVDKEQALREAYRVLKPGGRFMVADMVLVWPLPPEQAQSVDAWSQ